MKKNNKIKLYILTLSLVCLFSQITRAEDNKNSKNEINETKDVNETKGKKENSKLTKILDEKKLTRITVTGSSESNQGSQASGSAWLLKGEQLQRAKGGYDDINRVLRTVPGVNVVQEDGYGLRPNVGFRGASSDRSENITLMEDGVLVAPAPYAAPEAYYFPSTGRIEGIEVMKGASQIKYGPRTIGGSINMLSTSIPKEFSATANIRGGQNETVNGYFNVGQAFTHGGYLLETVQTHTNGFKRLDGGGDTGFDLSDFNGKFRINTDKTLDNYQELEVKLGAYDQKSNETYLGITREDFRDSPYRRYRGSKLDNLDLDHEQIHVKHFGEIDDNTDITNIFYNNTMSRNWYRLGSVGGLSINEVLDNPQANERELNWVRGADSEIGAFSLRNNRRSYRATGFQSVVGHDFKTGDLSHELEVSARAHYDYEDRFQDEDKYTMFNNDLNLFERGLPGSNANRKGEADAYAFYIQDKISYNDFSILPGIRYETIKFTRTDWGKTDPLRLGTEVAKNKTDAKAFIPGVALNYKLTEATEVFGSLHKGFAPAGPQPSAGADNEKSINYETGINVKNDSYQSELVFFFNDYENLLGADTASGGGQGTGDKFNAGKARVYGAEASVSTDLAKYVDTAFKLPVYANYTFTNSEFREDFESELYGIVRAGQDIPYIAKNLFASGVAVDHDKFRVGLDMFFQESMPTVAGASNLLASSAPSTDSHAVFNLETAYKIDGDKTQIFFLIENLFDREYIAGARPAGARPGMPQTLLVGVRMKL